ncbi:MAG: hypothetical protein E5V63_31165 [Mesorhizobium sp.]|nr:MAG: hypothetical protein E5V63_31165 [Mesorhizobium sp.]
MAKFQASARPTPATRDYKGANSPDHLENGTGQKHMDQLPNFVEHMWPMWRTPTSGSENSMRGHGMTPETAQRRIENGHTLNLQDQVALWSTPSVADTTGGRMTMSGDRSNEMPLKGQAAQISDQWRIPRSNEVGNYQYDRGDKTKPTPTLTGQAFSHPDQHILTHGEKSSLERRNLNPRFVEWLMGWPPGWTASACSATALSLFKQHMRSALLQLGLPAEGPPAQLGLFA